MDLPAGVNSFLARVKLLQYIKPADYSTENGKCRVLKPISKRLPDYVSKSFWQWLQLVWYVVLSTESFHLRLDLVQVVARHCWKQTANKPNSCHVPAASICSSHYKYSPTFSFCKCSSLQSYITGSLLFCSVFPSFPIPTTQLPLTKIWHLFYVKNSIAYFLFSLISISYFTQWRPQISAYLLQTLTGSHRAYYRKNSNIIRTIFTKNRGLVAGVRNNTCKLKNA